MNTQEARETGSRVAATLAEKKLDAAGELLQPVLDERTPFRLLDEIGAAIGAAPKPNCQAFLDRIAAGKTEGGWVVIAAALHRQWESGADADDIFARCREYIIAADIWYATDIFGERVTGPALVKKFDSTLDKLTPWRIDKNSWVRRTVGVAGHFWAKRSRGAADLKQSAARLLDFLEPMFEEWDMNAVKGISWPLKTLGRHYPNLVADWIACRLREGRPHRALMVRKALKFLTPEQRARALAMGEKT